MDREELIKKYEIDVVKLEKEQLKLAKELEIKDKIDFSLADKFGAISTTFLQNKLLCCIIICDKNYEIIDRAYVLEKARFPYLAGFRAYRELPIMILAYNKLKEKPDVFLISAMGIAHPRLGLASHFSLSTGIPTIGISNSVFDCEIKKDDIMGKGKKIGKILISKPQSKPMYITPGNLITIKSAYELCKRFINLPHKKPEPLRLVGKYARDVGKELK